MRPGSAVGPYKNPETIRTAARTKPAAAWKAWGRSTSFVVCSMPGNIHNVANTTAVMASQRHRRMRASAKLAALTIAR